MSGVPVKPTAQESPRQPYRSPRRAAAALKTRQAIRAAAETLFLRDGYAQTTMRAIAEQAGVSEKTIYLAYATKANLLLEVIRVAARGDQAPETISQRPEWRAVTTGPLEDVFPRFAALNAALMARTARIIALAQSAAAIDPELAQHGARARAATRADLFELTAELKRRGALAPGISEQDAADTIYAVASEVTVYLRLITECGWDDARYAELIARTLKANLSTP